MKKSILIVDDDSRVRTSLKEALSSPEMEIRCVGDAKSALETLEEAPAEIVLTDVRMPGMDGLELLTELRSGWPETSVVMMTAFDDLQTVASAMRDGATDFLVKPLDLHQLRRVIERISQDRKARRIEKPVESEDNSGDEVTLIGHDPAMVEIFKEIGRVAAVPTSVLIRGESGTGKELISRAIHVNSPAADQPFVPVNCTALPSNLLESELFGHKRGSFTGADRSREGRLAAAGAGTVFLDEIGDTSMSFQSKLLRVLQEQEFYPVGADRPAKLRARVIAATHRHLEDMVEAGDFREDLYFRLRVVEIRVPPLRERPGDIPVLADHLTARASRALNREAPVIAPETYDSLLAHGWPGNVRELENCLTRAVVLAPGDVIRPEHLGLATSRSEPTAGSLSLADVEREHVERVLRATSWNKAKAARKLAISRPRLDRLINRYDLEPDS